MLNKRFGAAPGGKGTAPEGIREKLERSGSTASKTERQAQLSPEQRKLLADWQAAKDRCEINRQLTDWIIDFTARRKRAEIAFLYHDCSVDHRDHQAEWERFKLCIRLARERRP